MKSPPSPWLGRLVLGAGWPVLVLSGCVAGAAPAEPPVTAGFRVMVRLPEGESADPQRIAEAATRAAGVPVRHLAAASSRWHSLGLSCAPEALCQEALRRLAGDKGHFEVVEPEGVRKVR